MPLLSGILSIVAVGALAAYQYLNYSKNIEQAKVKIKEEKRVESINKEMLFKNASKARIDNINNSKINLSLSKLAVQDGNLTLEDLKLLDKLQKAALKIDTTIKNPNCQDFASTKEISYKECISINSKNINFYSFNGAILYNQNSVIKDKDFSKDAVIWNSKKNKRYIKKDFKDGNKKADLLSKVNDEKIIKVLLNSYNNDSKELLGKKRFFKKVQKAIDKLPQDKKRALVALLEKKNKLFKKRQELERQKELEKQKIITLANIKKWYNYYQKEIFSLSNPKRYTTIMTEIKSLKSWYKKEYYKIYKQKMYECHRWNWLAWMGDSNSKCDEKKYDKKFNNLKYTYVKKKNILQSRLYTIQKNISQKEFFQAKLNTCYLTQQKFQKPNLTKFKECAQKIIYTTNSNKG